MSRWSAWAYQPQSVFLRRAIFQIHLWTGLTLGLYIVLISLSGSFLVYRDNLYRTFSPKPVLLQPGPSSLSDEQLHAAAQELFPGYKLETLRRGRSPNEAVVVTLTRGNHALKWLINPYTGGRLGNAVPFGFRLTDWLIDFHDNLLSGPTGRCVNGIAGTLVILSALTGMVVWWPGIKRWKRSLIVDLRSGWKQGTWSLHSAFGFWCVGFILLWGITGVYLSFQELFGAMADYLQPTDAAGGEGFVDTVFYWLSYAHFGRFGGRIPGCRRGGGCDEIFKAVWATFGVVPVVMAITGAIIWWNRRGSRAFRGTTKGENTSKITA